VPAFKNPSTKLVFDYWVSLNGGKPPAARRLDPVAIPKLMPYVLILERRSECGARSGFAPRFAGTSVCDFVGTELTGLPLDKYLPGEILKVAESNLTVMLDHPCGRWNTSATRSAAGRVSDVEYLSLPLCDELGTPDRIMVFMAVLSTRGFGETSALVGESMASEWIDLGSGIPDVQANPSHSLNSAL